MSAAKVLIIVEGGLVTAVLSNLRVQVVVKDWDNIKAGDAFDPNESANVEWVSPARLEEEIRADLPASLPRDSHPGWDKLEAAIEDAERFDGLA